MYITKSNKQTNKQTNKPITRTWKSSRKTSNWWTGLSPIRQQQQQQQQQQQKVHFWPQMKQKWKWGFCMGIDPKGSLFAPKCPLLGGFLHPVREGPISP